MLHPFKSALAITTAVVLSAGCAGTTETPDFVVGDDQGTIVVDNTTSTLGSATIYLVPETGTREMLGPVDPSGEAEFTVSPGVSAQYQLLANFGAEEMVSREFTFNAGTTVDWTLATNVLTTVPGGG